MTGHYHNRPVPSDDFSESARRFGSQLCYLLSVWGAQPTRLHRSGGKFIRLPLPSRTVHGNLIIAPAAALNLRRLGSPVQRNTLIAPVMSGEISLAPEGIAARFVLPPGQRIQICVGAVGVPITKFALSWDQ